MGGVSNASPSLCWLNWSKALLAADEPDDGDDDAPMLQRDGRHV